MTPDSIPTERLKKLVEAEGDDRQRLFGELWSDSYADLNIDFDTTTSKQLEDALQSAGATGETIYKCKGFLLGLARAGGIKLSPYLKTSGRRSRTAKTKRLTSPVDGNGGGEMRSEQTHLTKSPEQFLFGILDTDDMTEEEQQAVWVLIKYLKKMSIAD